MIASKRFEFNYLALMALYYRNPVHELVGADTRPGCCGLSPRLALYGQDTKKELTPGQIPSLRAKWENLSEFVREIKQTFSRHYNKRHGRRGFFWSERLKSVIVDNGKTLLNCLAYIDLNPVRAGLVEKPEDYRWSRLATMSRPATRTICCHWTSGLGNCAGNRLRTV